MDELVIRIVGLLAVSVAVAVIARRLALPYTVGLVVAGIGLAIVNPGFGPALTHDLIFDVILPPLLFEAALSLGWNELRGDMLPVLVLSTLGVVVSAVVVAAGMVRFGSWPLAASVVFGILIAATDPVAVIAMFKESGVKGRLRLLVESESLFNDGVAAVLFGLALAWAQSGGGATGDVMSAIRELLFTSGGGIAVGLVTGGAALLLAGRTEDHLVETGITAVAAYGSFLLAERLHVSGVLACVAAGILAGNLPDLQKRHRRFLSARAREFVIAFWEFAAFLANSIVFLLIGLAVAGIPFGDLGLPTVAVAIALVLLGRALTVYPLSLTFAWSSKAIDLRTQHVLWWGGLRGALALALALALPTTFAFHRQIQIAAFGVVAFSVLFQGLSMPWFLRVMGFIGHRGESRVER